MSKLVSGGTPSRGNPPYFTGKIPWVKTLDLNCSVVRETEECISEEAFRAIRGELLPIGTVMVAMYGGSGTIGKSGILGIKATTNQAVCSILPNPELFIPEYLHYWMVLVRPQWMLYSGGNRKDPNINKGVVERMKILLPPLPEQKRIVGILSDRLSTVDKARTATEAQLKAAKALPATYLRQVFDSPEAQKTINLEAICEAIVDCEHKTALTQPQGIPMIRTTNIRDGKLDIDNARRVSEEVYKEWTARIEPKPNDLILAREAPVGEVGIIPLDCRVCLGQRTVLIRPISQKILPMYLLYVLLTPKVREKMHSLSEGALVPHLNVADIRGFLVPIPPSINQQKYIVDALNKKMLEAIRLQRSLQSQLDTINKLPAARLRQAFKGEL